MRFDLGGSPPYEHDLFEIRDTARVATHHLLEAN
jgi:hypothetical protein